MRLLAFAALAVGPTVLLADAASDAIAGPWTGLIANGAFGTAMWVLLRDFIGKSESLQKRALEMAEKQLDSERKSCSEDRAADRAMHEVHHRDLLEKIAILTDTQAGLSSAVHEWAAKK